MRSVHAAGVAVKKVFANLCLLGSIAAGAMALQSCKEDPNGPSDALGGAAVTVAGRVVTFPIIFDYEQPLKGVTVSIPGHTAVAVSSGGNFSIANVIPPYDLWLIDNLGKKVMIWRGLTRPDPTVCFEGSNVDSSSLYSAAFSAAVYPTTAFPAAGSTTMWTIASPQGYTGGLVNTGTSPGSFTGGLRWTGTPSITANLHVVQVYFDKFGAPSGPGFFFGSRKGFTLQGGALSVVLRDTIAHVEMDTLTVTGTIPAGYAGGIIGGGLLMSDGGYLQLVEQRPIPGSLTFYSPRVGGRAALFAYAYDPSGGRSVTRADFPTTTRGAMLEVLPVPALLLPVPQGTGIRVGSRFTWSSSPQTVSILSIWEASSQTPFVSIVTSAATDSLPDLSSIGIRWPPGNSCSWMVESYGSFSSTDELAVSRSLLRSHSMANASPRGFTLSP